MRTLILGGVRSGKSRLAEARARASGLAVTYVATATGGDAEMSTRIAAHRTRRPENWRTLEEPLALAATLSREAAAGRLLLVECLTLWFSNLLHTEAARCEAECAALLETLPRLPGEVLLVSNETGLGIIPGVALARRYNDLAGDMHQALARHCDRVVFTVAGLAHVLKGNPWPMPG
ncbi:adenosylcobinamide kinase / adenosylcobinamide-phosphate guanylyltransferase [Burkholderiales bacterium]|nr:MAG: bifunctional adenosylcobinamide kinase/adenosylcobinamide-phosphate guanylyltransferase [Burkholderiales bacterium]CAG1007526.1 adenosylcobinamide kinase / adenosylcobinamide-phosphate guanylyltransferase [Burkholderiales bacterium]